MIPETRREPVTDRVDAMRALYEGGSNMRDIGAFFGLTGERVRQLLAVAGVESRARNTRTTDAMDVVARMRRTTAISFGGACIEAGVDPATTRRILKGLGMTRAFQRLFRLRHSHVTKVRRAELASQLADLARRLGRTPGLSDINADAETHWHNAYIYHFGTMRAAQIAAGLKPNGRGSAGHVHRRRTRDA